MVNSDKSDYMHATVKMYGAENALTLLKRGWLKLTGFVHHIDLLFS